MSSWLLDISDLAPFASIDDAKAAAMIEDASAMAALLAPCLASESVGSLTESQAAAVRAIIRGAVLRWNEAGTGAMQTQQAGPFAATIDTRQERRGMFWPSEIGQLQKICADTSKGGAFQIDTAPAVISVATDWCSPSFDNVF